MSRKFNLLFSSDFINKIHPNIKFTAEIEENNKLNFLDICITRKGQGFSTKVFRKPIASNKYLDFDSYNAPSQKAGIIYGLVHRVTNICSSKEDQIGRAHV